MLGRVFEGVMQPDDRHASGTFYTPVRLVEHLVDTVLTTLLAGRLGCDDEKARQLLQAPSNGARELIAEITVLDPAVGSGAFLLGVLERLTGILNRGEPRVETRRRILANNLFGVDLNPMAVRLAELRLWLAVIADDPA
jgi:type I restriction-modification system DNA methylase subunit